MYKTTKKQRINYIYLKKELDRILSLPNMGLRYEKEKNINFLFAMIVRQIEPENLFHFQWKNDSFEIKYQTDSAVKTIKAKKYSTDEWVFLMHSKILDDELPF